MIEIKAKISTFSHLLKNFDLNSMQKCPETTDLHLPQRYFRILSLLWPWNLILFFLGNNQLLQTNSRFPATARGGSDMPVADGVVGKFWFFFSRYFNIESLTQNLIKEMVLLQTCQFYNISQNEFEIEDMSYGFDDFQQCGLDKVRTFFFIFPRSSKQFY